MESIATMLRQIDKGVVDGLFARDKAVDVSKRRRCSVEEQGVMILFEIETRF